MPRRPPTTHATGEEVPSFLQRKNVFANNSWNRLGHHFPTFKISNIVRNTNTSTAVTSMPMYALLIRIDAGAT